MRKVLLAAGLGLAISLLSIRRLFLVTNVEGKSMEPALRSGDRVLVRRTKRVRAGQVVVFKMGERSTAKAPVPRPPWLAPRGLIGGRPPWLAPRGLIGGRPPWLAPRRSGQFLIKRAVAVPGDRIPAEWEYPDVHEIAGKVVPHGSFVLLGDNRAMSWDSRHHGFVGSDQFVGVVIRQLGSPND